MPKTEPFDRHTEAYERWFDANRWAWLSEVEAIRRFLPSEGKMLEVGVGTGRFAQPLGIRLGVEPSRAMGVIARSRGILTLEGVAEALPLGDGRFSAVLMVTTVCFLDDLDVALRECLRVLRPGGAIVIGFVDAESDLGRVYQARRSESLFYTHARFFGVAELKAALRRAGFERPQAVQTLFQPLDALRGIEPVREGHGEGSFVVLAATRPIDGYSSAPA